MGRTPPLNFSGSSPPRWEYLFFKFEEKKFQTRLALFPNKIKCKMILILILNSNSSTIKEAISELR